MDSHIYVKIREVLDSLGIRRGDHVLLHSDMGNLVRLVAPEEMEGVTDKHGYLLGVFHAAISDTLGPEGTICVLSSFTGYARFGHPFVLEESLPDKDLGAYTRFLFRQEGAVRSLNPLTGIIALGGAASQICEHRSAIGFGHESPWARMLELDGRMMFWGVGLGFMTFVHHVEHVVGVPHIYNKLYRTPVYRGGHEIDMPVTSAVRYLDFDVVYNLTKFEYDIKAAGMVRSTRIGILEVQVVGFGDVMSHLARRLSQDPFYLLDRVPKFVTGQVPIDGATGPQDHSLDRRSQGR